MKKNIFFGEKFKTLIRYRCRLPYFKAFYKRILISIKKWLQSTDIKNESVLWFPFLKNVKINKTICLNNLQYENKCLYFGILNTYT